MARGAPGGGGVHVGRMGGFAAFRLLDLLIKIVPESWAYAVSGFLALVLERIWGYRKLVVETNLRAAFPRKPSGEIRALVHRFYLHLGDLIVEIMRIRGLSAESLRRCIRFLNPELVTGLLERKKPVEAISGHFGNWEYMSLFSALAAFPCLCLYQPPKNPLFDRYLNRGRARFGGEPVRQDLFFRRLSHYARRGIPTFSLILIDQSPEEDKIDLWLPFLGRPTACSAAWERIARRLGAAVVFLDIVRESRGRYAYTFHLLSEDAGREPPERLSVECHRRLEAAIAADPPYWLWSHRRWKHLPPGPARL
jgi:KDO2-lipid IV(A) lauroyltransferase